MKTRTSRFQTVVTAVISNRRMSDGLEVIGQEPKAFKEESASWEETSKDSYAPREEARQRVLALLYHRPHPLA